MRAVVIGNGAAQFGDAGHRRILVVAGQQRVCRRCQHILRPAAVGEALPQVDGAGRPGARRHGFEDRRRQAGIKRIHGARWRNSSRPVNPPPSRRGAGNAIRQA